ncbi:FAD-dependent oxidoreductase [Streptomyces pratensis]|uniref:FAD-dependent oxidoreductase n=1 Tax=Streptomyces pratensis TaxID=1169025 RepID=UPI003630B6DB
MDEEDEEGGNMAVLGRHAVVIGGSMSGLMAARVLTDHFSTVTVLDRDSLPDGPCSRRGVPHAEHGHALLLGGKRKLEELFPGIGAELLSGGAVPFDPGLDLLMHQMGAMRQRFRSGDQGLSLTRALLEDTVRTRVAALPTVGIRDRTAVCGLTGTSGRVTGVELEGGGTLSADFVVNASGRGGAGADNWLRTLGYPAPETDVVKVDVGYTTRLFHRRPGERLVGEGLLHLMAGANGDKRAAAVFAVEGDRWMVTLGGWHRAHAPTDPAGFSEFAAGLPSQAVRDIVHRARPIDDGEAKKFTFPAARRRRFERLRVLPSGFVAVGDALCSFNPLYGQGMTVAALEAVALGRALGLAGGTSSAMARSYYSSAAGIIDAPWQMAVGGDFSHPQTTGPKPRGTKLLNWYTGRVLLASHVSVPVNRVLMDVQQLLAPPTAVLRPTTAVRTLFAARRSPALGTAHPRRKATLHV